jgi:hypothetical protein
MSCTYNASAVALFSLNLQPAGRFAVGCADLCQYHTYPANGQLVRTSWYVYVQYHTVEQTIPATLSLSPTCFSCTHTSQHPSLFPTLLEVEMHVKLGRDGCCHCSCCRTMGHSFQSRPAATPPRNSSSLTACCSVSALIGAPHAADATAKSTETTVSWQLMAATPSALHTQTRKPQQQAGRQRSVTVRGRCTVAVVKQSSKHSNTSSPSNSHHSHGQHRKLHAAVLKPWQYCNTFVSPQQPLTS